MYQVKLFRQNRWVTLSWGASFGAEWAIFERRRKRGERVRFVVNGRETLPGSIARAAAVFSKFNRHPRNMEDR